MPGDELLYEIVLIPKCPDLHKDVEPRYLIYGLDPVDALDRVLAHRARSGQRDHDGLYEYAVRGRTVLDV